MFISIEMEYPVIEFKGYYVVILFSTVKIPEEILKWDFDARRRYVKTSKKQGRRKIFHARGMLVGCAGAGKTTLLRKLQNRETEKQDGPTETTVGLDVYEDLFEIELDTLKCEGFFVMSFLQTI
jgi:polynucleotide 5'-kinase involved in rRNA processing